MYAGVWLNIKGSTLASFSKRYGVHERGWNLRYEETKSEMVFQKNHLAFLGLPIAGLNHVNSVDDNALGFILGESFD